jgi:hypothetical protein
VVIHPPRPGSIAHHPAPQPTAAGHPVRLDVDGPQTLPFKHVEDFDSTIAKSDRQELALVGEFYQGREGSMLIHLGQDLQNEGILVRLGG